MSSGVTRYRRTICGLKDELTGRLIVGQHAGPRVHGETKAQQQVESLACQLGFEGRRARDVSNGALAGVVVTFAGVGVIRRGTVPSRGA